MPAPTLSMRCLLALSSISSSAAAAVLREAKKDSRYFDGVTAFWGDFVSPKDHGTALDDRCGGTYGTMWVSCDTVAVLVACGAVSLEEVVEDGRLKERRRSRDVLDCSINRFNNRVPYTKSKEAFNTITHPFQSFSKPLKIWHSFGVATRGLLLLSGQQLFGLYDGPE